MQFGHSQVIWQSFSTDELTAQVDRSSDTCYEAEAYQLSGAMSVREYALLNSSYRKFFA